LGDYVTPAHPTSFGGLDKLIKLKPGLNKKTAADELSKVYSHSLHREYHKPRRYNPTFVYKKRKEIQADLIDVQSFKGSNDNVTFLMTLIDPFTKRAFIVPLTNKTGENVARKLKKVFDEEIGHSDSIYFDHGTEFKNRHVKKYLENAKIKAFFATSEKKSSTNERFNRSIQNWIYAYLSEHETRRYIGVLQDFVQSYNLRPHRSIGWLTPLAAEKDVNFQQVLNVHNQRYSEAVRHGTRKAKSAILKVGDTVRLKYLKTTFTRGYGIQFTVELFEIIEINTRTPIPTYIVKSLDTGEIIKGSFYSEELQRWKHDDVYRVEKVLKTRKAGNKTEKLVKWEGFSNAHNSWVDSADVRDVE
jgi:hypothetical protein